MEHLTEKTLTPNSKKESYRALKVYAAAFLGLLSLLAPTRINNVDIAYADGPIRQVVVGFKDDGRPIYEMREMSEYELTFEQSLDFYARALSHFESLPQREIPLTQETLQSYVAKNEHWFVDHGYLTEEQLRDRTSNLNVLLRRLQKGQGGVTTCSIENDIYVSINSTLLKPQNEHYIGKGVWQFFSLHEAGHGLLFICSQYGENTQRAHLAVEESVDVIAYNILAAKANKGHEKSVTDLADAEEAEYALSSALVYLAWKQVLHSALTAPLTQNRDVELLRFLREKKPLGWDDKERKIQVASIDMPLRQLLIEDARKYGVGVVRELIFAQKHGHSYLNGLTYDTDKKRLMESHLSAAELIRFMDERNLNPVVVNFQTDQYTVLPLAQ